MGSNGSKALPAAVWQLLNPITLREWANPHLKYQGDDSHYVCISTRK